MESRKNFKTSNPALNEKVFESAEQNTGLYAGGPGSSPVEAGNTMTMGGTLAKIYFLLAIVIAGCAVTWHFAFASAAGTEAIFPWVIGGSIAGLVLAIIICFNPKSAPILSPFYAAFEGLAIGGYSAYFEASYPGIVMQAAGLTLCVFLAMLMAYTSRIIKVTEKFKMGVVGATFGIFIFYMISWVSSMFFGMHVPMIHDSGMIGIGFSLFVVGIAALNLVLDFDFISTGVARKAPKNVEWYAAFGLMVTLIWLYIEVLRLVSKLQKK